jgi:hypothetical protein
VNRTETLTFTRNELSQLADELLQIFPLIKDIECPVFAKLAIRVSMKLDPVASVRAAKYLIEKHEEVDDG